MSSSGEQELRNAFNLFSLWCLRRYATRAASVKLVAGKLIQAPELSHYLVAVATDRATGADELILFEHYLTRKQFAAATPEVREKAVQRMRSFMSISPDRPVVHYVHISNEHPAAAELPQGLRLLKTADIMIKVKPGRCPPDPAILAEISSCRERPDAPANNVYEAGGGRIFSNLESLDYERGEISSRVQWIDESLRGIGAYPVNGIKLEDLNAELLGASTKSEAAPLGLFLVRQAALEDIRRYLKRNCVDRLDQVTASTWFLVSETVPFETPFPEHATVHEVAHLQDYGVVFWQRSRGAPTPLGKHFTLSFRQEFDSSPPAPNWLNVLVSNETDGSSTYLWSLRSEHFRWSTVREAAKMIKVLQRTEWSTEDKLFALFCPHANKQQADYLRVSMFLADLLLLVDGGMDTETDTDLFARLMVDFLNTIDPTAHYRLTVWIVGDDRLWERMATGCRHAANKYTMPVLTEDERGECLAELLGQAGAPDVATVQRNLAESNSRQRDQELLGNQFFLIALARVITGDGSLSSYRWFDVMESHSWKCFGSEGSPEYELMKKKCADFLFRGERSIGQYVPRTMIKLLAAKYLARLPSLLDVGKCMRAVGRELMDLCLFRHSPAGLAVIQQDLAAVRLLEQTTPGTLQATTDALQRNLLHVVHDCPELAELLIEAEVKVNQRCPLLNNCTPLQLADERADWRVVNSLLGHGATFSDAGGARLQKMSLAELGQVFRDCISYGCRWLIEWILTHRPDYRLSQHDVYCLAVHTELERDLLYRLLALAEYQRLPEREPEPYQFIWYNTALDSAVEDERYELAAFLVERLQFPPTEGFRRLQAEKAAAYPRLFELCATEGAELAEVRRLLTEQRLDPLRKYRGTNLLIQACAGSGSLELVRFLCESCGFAERLNDTDEHGRTALSSAMQQDRTEIVSHLLRCGALQPTSTPSPNDDDCVRPEEIDAGDFLSLVGLPPDRLMQLPIDYQRYEDDGQLLLHYYIFYVDEPDEATFRYLLAQYDDVDVRTGPPRDGETPLHIALRCGNRRCFDWLIEAGANVHAKSLRHGLSSLHYAVMGGGDRAILTRLLDDHRIDVQTVDGRGRSIAFHMPAERSCYRWLAFDRGLDVHRCDEAGQTILHRCVIDNHFFVRAEIEFLLLVVRISQSRTDGRGRIALHYAVEAGSLVSVRVLLKYRTDLIDVQDEDGVTPAQLARSKCHTAIVALFETITRR